MAVALIVAAGSGERLGADRPKAFVVLAGRPMLEWSVEAFARVEEIDRIIVAAPPGVAASGVYASADVVTSSDVASSRPDLEWVEGGSTRSHSVRNALDRASQLGPIDRVVVHDAARPMVTPELIKHTLAKLENADAAIAATPVTDTLKKVDEAGWVTSTVGRSGLWAAQTPQSFRGPVLKRALTATDEVLAQATDDAWLVQRAGAKVSVVESTPENFKITTAHDLRVAELLLQERISC